MASDPSLAKDFALTGLTSEIGNLTKLCKAGPTDETKAAFANSTAMILWHLANISRDLNLDFEATVETGITNISSMFEKRG